MSEKSGFFVSQSGDRKYTPDWLAGYVKALVTTGVYSSELGVVPADGMGVSVSAGRAWIEGYLYLNDSPLELAIATADSALHRRDSVIVRLNMTERTINSMVLTGTCDTSPLAPEIIRTADIYDLKIAEIYVAAGTTKITQAMIKDTRLDDSVCGITVSAVQHIPTEAYMVQMEAEFREWFSCVQGILGEDEAGNLLQLLNAHKTTHQLKTYTSLDQIGLSGEVTMAQVCDAMSRNSMLVLSNNRVHATDYVSDVPDDYGTITVTYAAGVNYCVATYTRSDGAAPIYYVGKYDLDDCWTGWKQMADTDYAVNKSGDTMTGVLTIKKGKYPQLKLEPTDLGKMCAVAAGDRNVQIKIMDDPDSDDYRILYLISQDTVPSIETALRINDRYDGADHVYNVLHTGNMEAMGISRIVSGTVTGSSRAGEDSPNSITFPFKPKLVYVTSLTRTPYSNHSSMKFDNFLWVEGVTQDAIANTNYGAIHRYYKLEGNTLSWWVEDTDYYAAVCGSYVAIG